MEKRKTIAIVWMVVLVIGLLVGNFFLLDEVDSDESLCLVKVIDRENEKLDGVTVRAYSDSRMEDPVSDKKVTGRNGEALLRVKRSRGENNPVMVSIERYGFYSEVREVRDLHERQPRDSKALVVEMWRAGSIGVNLSEKIPLRG